MGKIIDFPGGNRRSPRFVYSDYWIPTRESGQKVDSIEVECALNQSFEGLDNRTPFEDAIIHKSAKGLSKIFPYLKRTLLFREYLKRLPLNEGEFIHRSIYSKTGGVLNLFNPGIREDMDNELKTLLAQNGDKSKSLEIWRITPSELWSDLTPQLVWAGGGEQEMKLLKDFLTKLTNEFDGEGFESRGECLISTIKFLRRWQCSPNRVCGGKRPMDAIREERAEVFKRKISFLREMGIETDFA